MLLIDTEKITKKILNKLKELEVDTNLALNDDLGSLGLSSIKSIQLIVALEELFDIEFDDEELLFENFSTLFKIVKKIEEKISNS